MKSFKFNKNDSVRIIVITLFISLSLNFYNSVLNSKYKILLGRETYNSLLELRTKNESSSNILNTCIKAKSINNQELFTLYKNFSSIHKEFNSLWLKYKTYKEEKPITIGKRESVVSETSSDVYKRIENLLYEYMNYQMNNDNEFLILGGSDFNNFRAIESLTRELNDYFIDFDSKNYKDLDEEKKRLVSIKEKHWVRSLKEINSLLEPYLNHEFIIKE